MKNIKFSICIAVIMGTLTGCGGSKWNQDPLAGKDKAFKEGKPAPTLPQAPKPVESGAVRVYTVEFYHFSEGEMGKFPIAARILETGYTATIYLENIEDFPGATFDAADGKFSWTPPTGTVGSGGDLQVERVLKIQVVGEKTGAPILVGSHSVPIKISKPMSEPVILEVSKDSANLREGQTTTLTVRVRDRDAGAATNTYPDLQISALASYGNISPFVTLTRVFSMGNGEFVFNLTVDLTEAELTKSRDRFGFQVKAVSHFHRSSKPEKVVVYVVTSFANIQSTWSETIEAPIGVRKDFQFMFFDPKDELYLEAPIFKGLPTGANVYCRGINVTRQFCSLIWTPTAATPPGEIRVRAEVIGKNQDSMDQEEKKQFFDFRVRVPASTPNPTPAPTPEEPDEDARVQGGLR